MKEHKLAAIVFTDIVGYTRQMEADEEATMKLLARQREVIFPIVQEFGGKGNQRDRRWPDDDVYQRQQGRSLRYGRAGEANR